MLSCRYLNCSPDINQKRKSNRCIALRTNVVYIMAFKTEVYNPNKGNLLFTHLQ